MLDTSNSSSVDWCYFVWELSNSWIFSSRSLILLRCSHFSKCEKSKTSCMRFSFFWSRRGTLAEVGKIFCSIVALLRFAKLIFSITSFGRYFDTDSMKGTSSKYKIGEELYKALSQLLLELVVAKFWFWKTPPFERSSYQSFWGRWCSSFCSNLPRSSTGSSPSSQLSSPNAFRPERVGSLRHCLSPTRKVSLIQVRPCCNTCLPKPQWLSAIEGWTAGKPELERPLFPIPPCSQSPRWTLSLKCYGRWHARCRTPLERSFHSGGARSGRCCFRPKSCRWSRAAHWRWEGKQSWVPALPTR